MFVCICKGITDTQIKQSVKNGANSLQEVRLELGAATQCCKCLPEVRDVVNQALESTTTSTHLFPADLFFPA